MQEINTLNNLDSIYHNKFSGFPENVQFQCTWFLDLMKLKINVPCWEIGPLLQQKKEKKKNLIQIEIQLNEITVGNTISIVFHYTHGFLPASHLMPNA